MIRSVLVTSGGTTEPIDAVRGIANKSTGKLGSLIAEGFAAGETVERVYYIHAKGAALPDTPKLVPIEIETADDLRAEIERLLHAEEIDAVVHTMEVSEYRVKAVVSAEAGLKAAKTSADSAAFAEELAGQDLRDGGTHLTTDADALVLLLERAPKILPLFRTLAPKAVIVGFQLLSSETGAGLIDAAYRLLLENGCDYFFANDASLVPAGRHEGYLINSGRFVFPFSGRENIAAGIVQTVLGK